MDVEGMNGPSVQTFGCHKCGNSFSHAPKVWNVGGIPARTFFFCSSECLAAYLDNKPAPRRRDPLAEGESVGLSIDMLDADRLREWARLLLVHGADIGHWGSVPHVAGKMQIMATNIEKAVRDIGVLRAQVDALASEPRQAPAGWQGMDSAPKDGSLVLLYGRFVDGEHFPSYLVIGLWFQGYTDRGWWVSSALPFSPTHWMPLPPAPSLPEGQ